MTAAACPACTMGDLAVEVSAAAHPDAVFSVPSMRCAACIATIESGLAAISGIDRARVNLSQRRVTVQGTLAPDTIARHLADLGYEAHAFDPETLKAQTDARARDLLLRLGVAGFAMMNVMLLSVAVWSGATDATRDLFHLLSAAIALPVALFSAQPFFRTAWSALRVGRLNMDVPISLAILLAGGMSLYEALNGGAHAYFDAALSLTFFLLIGRYLEHRTRAASRSAAQDLAALEDRSARRVLASGTFETVAVTDLRIGDTVMVPTGARLPVDGRLLDQGAVTDRSLLTGESDAVNHKVSAALQAGEINLGAPLRVQATAVGADTSLHQLAHLVETAEQARNRYTALADRAAGIYAPAVHLLALGAFVGWFWASGDLRLSLNIAIAVLIITCPCALGLAVPAVSTAAVGRLFKLGFLVKSATALERLAEVDRVIFDKTGTLTLPGVGAAWTEVPEQHRGVARALADASDHPVSRAIAAQLDAAPAKVSDLAEVSGAGMSGTWEGRPVWLGRGDAVNATCGSALVLKIGGRIYPLSQSEALRDGAKAALRGLEAQGLGIEILSGDRADKAQATAHDLGVSTGIGSVSPQEKHDRIADYSAQGERVCMIGDGLNDTAALAAAHASVAPASALDAARTASDVVLISGSLADLPKLFATARHAVLLCRQNFAIAAAYNAIAIPVALSGYATPLLAALAMSVSSITVLLNALRVWRDV